MGNRVSAIQSRLGKIPEHLENSKILMIAHSKIHILYSNTRVDKLLILLQQLPLKLNSDNITLDNIDDLIKNKINCYFSNVEKKSLPKGKKYSNKLMQWRILLQLIAILVLVGFAYFFKN